MAEPGLRIERQGRLLILTIARPARANALDAATSAAIDEAVEEAERDTGIGAILLTGAGDRAFCSGMDMKEAAAIGAGHGLIPGRGFAGLTERRRTKPLILAINGTAVAGGMEMLLAADIVIAADHARFGLSEVKRGLFAFAGGIQRLAHAVPRATGLWMILTGETVDAARMLSLGLVSEVVPADRLMPRAREVAEQILGFDTVAVRRAKMLFDSAADMPIDQALRFGRAYGEETLASAGGREGIAAFAEGRGARFNDSAG